jgi:LysM repeat protein
VNKHLFAAILVAAALSGCAAPRQSIQTQTALPLPPPAAGGLRHTVAPKETLWSIGKRYGVSHREIMRANNLTDPTQVPAGSVLVIPRGVFEIPRVPMYPNSQWNYIVVHHSDTEKGNAKFIDGIHRKRGFSNGLGYHFIIDNGTMGRDDGEVEVGHRWKSQMDGAHCDAGNMNHQGIGICLIGDFTNRPPSSAQMEALVGLVEQLSSYYGIPNNRIIRHKDVPGKRTACPGSRFPWWKFRDRISRDRES